MNIQASCLLEGAAVSVAGDCHHLVPTVGLHPDQLLLDAHVQLWQGPVTALQGPEKTPLHLAILQNWT